MSQPSYLLQSFLSRQIASLRRRPLSFLYLIRSIVAGVLMGVGSGLSKRALTSNGLVYTALFSAQGWLALVFIIIGYGLADWLAHRIKK